MARVLLVLITLFLCQHGFANSCCGQSPASFPVLALEQTLSINASYAYSQAQGRIWNPEQFIVWEGKERNVQSFQMSFAGTIAEHHQWFINTALLNSQYKDVHQNEKEQNFSDTMVGYHYEVLPEYHFSPWKPVIHVSMIGNIPTGQSIYDDIRLSEGADVTGHNQWGLGIGLTARKVFFPLTFILQGRSLRVFKKQFDDVEVGSFYDSSLALLVSYATSWKSLSINTGITTSHLSPITLGTGMTSQSMQNTTLLAGFQKSLDDAWTVGCHYSDQTLLGPAKNSILNKTITLNLNYNYF